MPWWHSFGRMADFGTMVITVGPTQHQEPPEALTLAKDGPTAYLGTKDHEPTTEEHEEYIRRIEAHA